MAVTAFTEIVPFACTAIKARNEDKDLTEPFWGKLQETFDGFLSEMPSRFSFIRSFSNNINNSDVYAGQRLPRFRLMSLDLFLGKITFTNTN